MRGRSPGSTAGPIGPALALPFTARPAVARRIWPMSFRLDRPPACYRRPISRWRPRPNCWPAPRPPSWMAARPWASRPARRGGRAPPLAERALLHFHNHIAESGGHLLIVAREAPARWPIELPDLASRLPPPTPAAARLHRRAARARARV